MYIILVVIMSTFINLFGYSSLDHYAVNFDESLGKKDPYFNTYYQTLSKRPSQWNKNLRKYSGAQIVQFCRSLYDKNNLSKTVPDDKPRIPLIIHQIWLGSPLPEKYKKWQEAWQSMPDFEYKLWTDKDVEKLNLISKNIYEKSKNYGQKADILTAEILYQFGGIYIDIDLECLQPEMFALLNRCYDFYIGLHPLDLWVIEAGHAIMASIKGHPYFEGYLKDLPKRWADSKNKVNNVATHNLLTSGPGFFADLIISYLDKGTKDIVFPPTFFYPLGYAQVRKLSRQGLDFEAIKKKVLKPESVAIHWWDGNWLKPNAQLKG